MVVALCIYAVIPALAERFVLDGVGYTVTSAVQKTVRVDSIGLPGQTSGQDTIRIVIPEKVVNAGTEYAVTEVGSEGQTELINTGYTSKPFIIQFPSSLTKLHKGTLTHPNACLVFSPMQAVFPGEMFRDCTIYSLALPEGMTEISNNFARNCRIYGEVRLPSTMRHIGDYAFAGDKFYESKGPRVRAQTAHSRRAHNGSRRYHSGSDTRAYAGTQTEARHEHHNDNP